MTDQQSLTDIVQNLNARLQKLAPLHHQLALLYALAQYPSAKETITDAGFSYNRSAIIACFEAVDHRKKELEYVRDIFTACQQGYTAIASSSDWYIQHNSTQAIEQSVKTLYTIIVNNDSLQQYCPADTAVKQRIRKAYEAFLIAYNKKLSTLVQGINTASADTSSEEKKQLAASIDVTQMPLDQLVVLYRHLTKVEQPPVLKEGEDRSQFIIVQMRAVKEKVAETIQGTFSRDTAFNMGNTLSQARNSVYQAYARNVSKQITALFLSRLIQIAHQYTLLHKVLNWSPRLDRLAIKALILLLRIPLMHTVWTRCFFNDHNFSYQFQQLIGRIVVDGVMSDPVTEIMKTLKGDDFSTALNINSLSISKAIHYQHISRRLPYLIERAVHVAGGSALCKSEYLCAQEAIQKSS